MMTKSRRCNLTVFNAGLIDQNVIETNYLSNHQLKRPRDYFAFRIKWLTFPRAVINDI